MHCNEVKYRCNSIGVALSGFNVGPRGGADLIYILCVDRHPRQAHDCIKLLPKMCDLRTEESSVPGNGQSCTTCQNELTHAPYDSQNPHFVILCSCFLQGKSVPAKVMLETRKSLKS